MSVSDWKEIDLFTIVPSDDVINLSEIKGDIKSLCYNSTSTVICDSLGWVYVYSSNWQSESFKAYDGPILQSAICEENFLVTLAHDDRRTVHIQVFNINNSMRTPSTWGFCFASAKLECSNLVTALNISQIDTHLFIAFGTEVGDLYIHHNKQLMYPGKDISPGFRNFSLGYRPVTGIQFKKLNKLTWNMFVCTNNGVFCFNIAENSNVYESKIVLDNEPEASRCSAMSKNNFTDHNYFVVGRDDAVYCFTSHGRGPCYPINGVKQILKFNENFMFIVMAAESSTYAAKPESTIIIIDIFNKIKVLNKAVDPIIEIIIQPHGCYVVTETRRVLILKELELRKKIRKLLSKHLYDIAIRHLEDASKSMDEVGNIYLAYGDYLLNNGDPKSAVDMYTKTINIVAPYRIIEKLLDSRYNAYLAKYLKALIDSGHNNGEYQKLLQNCTDRLNLGQKIEHVYLNEADKDNNLKTCLDLRKQQNESAENGLTNPTVEMLTSYFETDQPIDTNKILSCDEEAIFTFLTNKGDNLMQTHPDKVTAIFKIVCSNPSNLERCLPILLSNKDCCISLLEEVIRNVPQNFNKSMYNILFQMYLQKWKTDNGENCEKIIAFLKAFEQNINIDHILVLCGLYKFWDGIMNSCQNFEDNKLYIKNVIKKCKSYSQLLKCDDNIDVELWIKTIQKYEFTSEDSVKMLNTLMNNSIIERNNPLLHVLKTLVGNENISAAHVRSFFSQEYVQYLTDLPSHSLDAKVSNEIKRNHNLLDNYINNPIEFRSSICDKCRDTLKLPVVYYLCQHSFHKQCISAYSQRNSCISCAKELTKTQKPNDNSKTNKLNAHHIMLDISSKFGSGMFSNVFQKQKYSNRLEKIETNPFEIGGGNPSVEAESNHLEDKRSKVPLRKKPLAEYDSNLNPFES